MAEYGLSFEGKNGNVMFSDTTPSMAYMGDAVWGSWGNKTSEAGSRTLYYYANYASGSANYNFYAGAAPKNSVGITVRKERRVWTCVCTGGGYFYDVWCDCMKWRCTSESCSYVYSYPTISGTITLVDNARISNYTVESYDRPTVFIYSSSSTTGANVLKVTDSGSTGARGYKVWDLVVMLTYTGAATDATAKTNIRLLCFGKVDPAYNNAGHGMVIKDGASNTMFHSDFEPCKAKDLLTISFSSGGVVNPTQSYQSGSTTTVSSLGKPAHQAVELGRQVNVLSSYFSNVGRTVYFKVTEVIAGLRWTGSKWVASYVAVDVADHAGTTPVTTSIKEPSNIQVPIIDADDY